MTDAPITLPAPTASRADVVAGPNPLLDFCRQQPLGAASFVMFCIMMVAGIFSQWVVPYDPLDIDFASILAPPSWEHWCGTDAYGRDILSRIIWGARTALVIGFTSSFFG